MPLLVRLDGSEGWRFVFSTEEIDWPTATINCIGEGRVEKGLRELPIWTSRAEHPPLATIRDHFDTLGERRSQGLLDDAREWMKDHLHQESSTAWQYEFDLGRGIRRRRRVYSWGALEQLFASCDGAVLT